MTIKSRFDYVLRHLPWGIAGPLIFLLAATVLVPFCPEEKKSELIFLIAGAAITRVKFAPPINLKPPDDIDDTVSK